MSRHDHHDHDHSQHAGHSDHTGHWHGLSRSDEVRQVSDSRLLWSVGLNQLLTVGQVIAGLVSGSSALLSDAAHNFSDANSLLIAYIARRVSRREADERYTFGYRRAELIGAVINLTLLAAVGVYLIYEGLTRLWDPQPIIGWLMAAAAALALVVDLATAALLWAMSRGSINVRAAFIHNIVDALGSLAVLVGAGAVIGLGWTWVDPALTLLISAYVLWQAATLLPGAVRILMEGAPADFSFGQLVELAGKIDGLQSLHHIHVWELDEQHRAIEAHVVIAAEEGGRMEAIKRQLKQLLADRFGIAHSTLEFEYAGTPGCEDAATVGSC